MNKPTGLIIFLIILSAHAIALLVHHDRLLFISKALLVPVLMAWFLARVGVHSSPLIKWIVGALLFSWLGDMLLLFQERNSLFFLLGLSAFLLAHIFYIVFFHRVRVKESVKSNLWFLLVVVVYYGVLITFLGPWLGDMRIPVRIYGIVISFMFMLALHMLFIRDRRAGRWMMFGALLFVLSDSILAINKFYQAFEAAGLLVMITYGLAQLFIVEGASRYIGSSNSD